MKTILIVMLLTLAFGLAVNSYYAEISWNVQRCFCGSTLSNTKRAICANDEGEDIPVTEGWFNFV